MINDDRLAKLEYEILNLKREMALHILDMSLNVMAINMEKLISYESAKNEYLKWSAEREQITQKILKSDTPMEITKEFINTQIENYKSLGMLFNAF